MHYIIQLLLFLAICSYFILNNFKDISFPTRLLFFYALGSGAFVAMMEPYVSMGFVSSSNLRIIAGKSLIYSMILVIFVFCLSDKSFERFFKFMIYASIFSSFCVIIRKAFGLLPWGLGLNSSTEGTYLAFMMPLIWFHPDPLIPKIKKLKGWINDYLNFMLKTIPVFAIIATQSAIGIFGTVLSFMTYFIVKNYSKFKTWNFWKNLLIFSIPGILFICLNYLRIGNDLFDDNHRIKQWLISFAWFLKNANPFLGTGLGTYEGFGPYIQVLHDAKIIEWFTNSHNDWFQIMFELGLIGLILSVIVYIKTLVKTFKIPHLFASIFTFGTVAGLNMPLRYPISSLACLMLLRMAYKKNGDQI